MKEAGSRCDAVRTKKRAKLCVIFGLVWWGLCPSFVHAHITQGALEQEVPWPLHPPRPPLPIVWRSMEWPIAIHASMNSFEVVEAWGHAVELAFALLESKRWPLPPIDFFLGGTADFDIYILPSLEDHWSEDPVYGALLDPEENTRKKRLSRALLDSPWPIALRQDPEDAATVHAVVSLEIPIEQLISCAIQITASAGLLALDPAEAESSREATAAWLAWKLSGEFGCDEGALIRQQRASSRALLSHDPRDAEGGAIAIASIAARYGADSVDFMRDAWLFARQRSKGPFLRGEPDLLRVLFQNAILTHDPIEYALEAMASARFFAGRWKSLSLASRPEIPFLAALPPEAEVPIFSETEWSKLPRRLMLPEGMAAVEAWGSAYARVHVEEAPPASRLRAWLDGEAGTEWSLIAIVLDKAGKELRRLRTPPTRMPRAFLPIDLPEGASEVILVVTALPSHRDPRQSHSSAHPQAKPFGFYDRVGLDLDRPISGPHGFRITIARGD
ncbi:MAG: hypothetical protein NZM37_00840 [Sandaracinaceae bacterium]|nr:hypothetical protein [Sandaracinaceae bacterium]